jgi:hypothetical protein
MKKSLKQTLLIIAAVVIILAALILLYAKFTGFVIASTPTSVSRSVKFVKAVNVTKINVVLAVNSKDSAFGISENIPEGFAATSASSNGIIGESTVEWLFVPGIKTSLTYSLQANSIINQINFTGSWFSMTSQGNMTGKVSLSR